MPLLRRLALLSLVLAYGQIVFGAVVRITGSGMGCGDHWPMCNGQWFPPLDRPDLIIEITHRYIAAALTLGITALLAAAWRVRREPGIGGSGGVLRAAALAAGLVVAAALLGAATVRLGLHPWVVVGHLTLAIALLAVLALTVIRAGGFGAGGISAASAPGTFRSARVAVALALLTLVLGALTANHPGAAVSCGGFPWCRWVSVTGFPLGVQITHRVLAFVLLGHVWGITVGIAKRAEPPVVLRSARFALAAIGLQILVAAAMVELRLPPALQSLHQALGTLVWLAVFVFAALASRATAAELPSTAQAATT